MKRTLRLSQSCLTVVVISYEAAMLWLTDTSMFARRPLVVRERAVFVRERVGVVHERKSYIGCFLFAFSLHVYVAARKSVWRRLM